MLYLGVEAVGPAGVNWSESPVLHLDVASQLT